MKSGFIVLCVAMVGVGVAQAATYSDMAVDVSALPKEKRFIRELVLSRVWARTPPSAGGRASSRATAAGDSRPPVTLEVRFVVDATSASLPSEGAVVRVKDGKAEIRGGRFRALVFGAGVLLRAIRYGEETFELSDGEYRFSPANPYRIAYFARHFNNWYLKAGAEELVRYVDDLALWGMNGFHMQLDYPVVDMVWSTEGDRAVFAATSVALAERARALDLDLSTCGGDNCAPEDMPPAFRATKDPKGSRGADEYNVCPEKPGALEYLLKLRQEANDRMKHIPLSRVSYWPFDEGGCACEKCAPWGGNGYVRLIERLRKMNEKAFPGVKHIVSTWFFRDDDWEAFYDYLKKQDWIDALLIDAHGDFPKYPLEHPLPKDIPVITFPEISMWGRFPWGGTGANPLAARFERLYRQCEAVVSGFMLYSEGIYEDVNKIVINGLYINPKQTHDDVLREYARWELPGCDEKDFVTLCAKLEDIYETQSLNKKKGRRGHRMSRYVKETEQDEELSRRARVAHEAAALADTIDGAILPRMRRSWRWRQIYLRAKIDEAVYSARDVRTPAALPAYAELTDIYHAEKQVERLYDGTWRGYTCPPFRDIDKVRPHEDCAASMIFSAGLSPEEFRSPPHEAKPHTWWHWMNGNVTKEGITADLEAMARVGIGGVQIFDAGLALPKGPITFATEAWYDCLAHANREAKRLGLELCIANCSGWTSSAGPWITPELAMKFVTNTTVRVKGGERFDGALPLPKNTHGFYEDIAVLAFPTPVAQMKWMDFDWQVFRKRGAEHAPVMPAKLTDGNVPHAACVAKSDILDLTAAGRVALVASARSSGRVALQRDRGLGEARPSLHLTWDAPSSHPEWTVLRIGYMCNGRTNRSASQAGLGLECDKLDPHAVDVHFDAYVGECLRRFGRGGALGLRNHGEGGFNGVLLDSYEVHGQNWTRGFEKTFAARMGYSIMDYLPILAGYPVESAAATERFLKDFRLTLSEQFVKNYAQRLEQRCHENGLVFSCEPYGNGPFNDLEYARHCDIPMSEFWQPYTNGTDLAAMARDPHRKFMEARWGNRGLGNGKTVAAAAHVWGKKIVGAEAFTAYPTRDAGRWLQGPFELKAQGDRVLADGVNRMIFHRYAHQPWTNPTRYPGMTMAAYGGHFDRTQTWWEDGMKAFCSYLARAQHLLQQGTFVADVLLCTAGEAPDYGTDGVIPEGYDGDRCHPNALAECRVEKGSVIVPGGVRYRVVGTPPRTALRPEVNAALARIEKAGATVVEYGDVADALKRLGCAPDFVCDDRDVRWLHRQVGGDEVYFVAVPNKTQKKVSCSFRVMGKVPELWDAVSGTIAETPFVEQDGRTEVVLDCAPAHSVFVVFREKKLGDGRCLVGRRVTNQKGDAERHCQQPTTNDQRLSVTGAWHVTFFDLNRQRDVTAADFDHLASWTESVDTDIRYFSGTATYTKKVSCPQTGGRIALDLGEVKNMATVTVNGKVYPTLWKPPFVVDITDAVEGPRLSRPQADGRDKRVPPPSLSLDIQIKVTNYWPNRLIGDARHPDDCAWDDGKMSKGYPLVKAYPDWLTEGKRSPTGRHAFSTCRLWEANEPLLESGLLGPVCLRFEKPSSTP